jgi:hypothetical protein
VFSKRRGLRCGASPLKGKIGLRLVAGTHASRGSQGTVPTSKRLRTMRIIGTRLCLLVAGATLVAGAAFAQAPNPAAPLDSTPGAKPPAPTEDLSKKLNQSSGVIQPKEVDPAIEKGVPVVRDPNGVPPPGTSGGSAAPQPK